MAKSSICKRVFSRTLGNRRKRSVARLLLLWFCHDQCGLDTLDEAWALCDTRPLLWQKQRKTPICELSGQMAYTDTEASAARRFKTLMKSAASAAFCASGRGFASNRLDRDLFPPHQRCGD